ncbi:hypothetical protein SDC9_132497 [bioreactor metagenome]|uniref:Uncharacterized protein n=1 Tax=bioreactor metagenome TaxID=1076179 RepID=A0A645D7S8_9ZZZZ
MLNQSILHRGERSYLKRGALMKANDDYFFSGHKLRLIEDLLDSGKCTLIQLRNLRQQIEELKAEPPNAAVLTLHWPDNAAAPVVKGNLLVYGRGKNCRIWRVGYECPFCGEKHTHGVFVALQTRMSHCNGGGRLVKVDVNVPNITCK